MALDSILPSRKKQSRRCSRKSRKFSACKSSNLERQIPRIEQSESRLAAIVESSEDAIIGKTLYGIITSWNAAAARLFGYKPEEIIGHSILELVPPELHQQETCWASGLSSDAGDLKNSPSLAGNAQTPPAVPPS